VHELSIAQALVEQIEEAAREAGDGSVLSAHIIVGGLSGVDAEALRVAFPIATDGTRIADTRLDIEEDPAVIVCNACGSRTTPDFPFPVCTTCDSVDVTIEGGQNLMLASIELA
jgi:hydrogenase nickel incorporation protein HypA/HybF